MVHFRSGWVTTWDRLATHGVCNEDVFSTNISIRLTLLCKQSPKWRDCEVCMTMLTTYADAVRACCSVTHCECNVGTLVDDSRNGQNLLTGLQPYWAGLEVTMTIVSTVASSYLQCLSPTCKYVIQFSLI